MACRVSRPDLLVEGFTGKDMLGLAYSISRRDEGFPWEGRMEMRVFSFVCECVRMRGTVSELPPPLILLLNWPRVEMEREVLQWWRRDPS